MKKLILIILVVITLSLCLLPATGINADVPVTVTGTIYIIIPGGGDPPRTVGGDNVITQFSIGSTETLGWEGGIVGTTTGIGNAITHIYNVGPILVRAVSKPQMEFVGEIAGLSGTANIEGNVIIVLVESTDGITATTQGKLIIVGIGGELAGLRGVLTITNYNYNEEDEDLTTLDYEGKIHFGN